MNRPAGVLAILGVVAVTGCASGPRYSEAQATLQALPEGQGRVYFYRTQIGGAAVQPNIYLNGQEVGSCEPDGVFFKDLPEGKYEASAGTEVTHKLSFVVNANEEKFVKCYLSIGFFVGHPHLELVDPNEAREEIQSLSLTGS
jgi:hypothetical protein